MILFIYLFIFQVPNMEATPPSRSISVLNPGNVSPVIQLTRLKLA